MIKAIVSDFDDALVRSEDLKQAACYLIFRDLSPEAGSVAQEFVRRNFGLPRREMMNGIAEALCKEGLISPDLVEEISAQYLQQYSTRVEELIVNANEMLGASQALKGLSSRYPLYLNSATPQAELERIIWRKNWKHFFKAVFGSPPGTKTEHLGEVIVRENILPHDVVVIGDGESDLASARYYKTCFIGIPNKRNNWEGKEFPVVSDLRHIEVLLPNLRPLTT